MIFIIPIVVGAVVYLKNRRKRAQKRSDAQKQSEDKDPRRACVSEDCPNELSRLRPKRPLRSPRSGEVGNVPRSFSTLCVRSLTMEDPTVRMVSSESVVVDQK